jgi:hypothetical protein
MGKAELTAEALTQLISFKGDDMYAQKLTFAPLKMSHNRLSAF